MSKYQHFEVHKRGEATEIRLANPLTWDITRYAQFHQEVDDFVKSDRPTFLLVDFSEVDYCSTAIISALLRAKNTIVSGGGKVRFWGMCESVREGFRMLNLDGPIFDIYETSGSAIATL